MSYSPGIVAGMEALGRSLRDARWRARLSQTDLERLSGLDQTVISRLENGKLPSLVFWRLAALIAALGPAWDPPRLERDHLGRWNLTPELEASLFAQIEAMVHAGIAERSDPDEPP